MALKPCWAMSPLVVSQVLPNESLFDVVVFDEASQVPPHDAIPSIMRGKQVVVAGDRRQLPPTTFFMAADDGAAEEEIDWDDAQLMTDDLESVLDLMVNILPPPAGTRSLRWHYRSRDERLIAFSNANYYSWNLITFPGVDPGDCIRHELVPYSPDCAGQEESASREVLRVVGLVVEHARERPNESLGIITMGIKHADRISEAIRQHRLAEPELESFFQEDRDEPFFVKNLERVQGDERDAIILSVGYGKTVDGRMLYRFGPLNLEGGERRLNVAVTRAKRRLTVVSSFSASDMDPERLHRDGTRLLKSYLEYAESNGRCVEREMAERPAMNPFESDVRDRLETAGVPVIAQYGVSGYYLDFAAQHRDQPGRMVLAIECDGRMYHSSPAARDRDRLRQEHLERLGWRFVRIWSSDWSKAPEKQVDRVLRAYEAELASREPREHAATADEGDGSASREDLAAPEAPSSEGPAWDSDIDSVNDASPRAGRRPYVLPGLKIDEYSPAELEALLT
jgi:very-short-patch-repair endonuclease